MREKISISKIEEIEKILKLYQEGCTLKQIADILCLDEEYVEDKIRRLNNLELQEYTPKKRNELIFQNYVNSPLKQSDFIDKDLLTEIIDLMMNNYLMIEIAVFLDIPESLVESYIGYLKEESNPFYNVSLYELCMQKQRNVLAIDETTLYKRLRLLEQKIKPQKLKEFSNSPLIRRYNLRKRNEEIAKEYLASGKTISEQKLATKYQVSVDVVHKILRGKDKYQTILNYLSQEELEAEKRHWEQKKQEHIEKYRIKLTVSNNSRVSEDERKINTHLYANSLFWLQVIFTFRLTLEEIAQLLNYDSLDILNDNLHKIASQHGLEQSLIYLFSSTSPSVHRYNMAKLYIKDVLNAKRTGQKEELKKLLARINDVEYRQIMRKNLSFDKLTYEEKLTILKYCLKYALPMHQIPYHRSTIGKFCPEEFQEEYREILEFNKSSGWTKCLRGQKIRKQAENQVLFEVRQLKVGK